jgi:hypothetical protein
VVIVLATGTVTTGALGARAAPPPEPGEAAPALDPRAVQTAIDLSRTTRDLGDVERRIGVTRQELASAQATVGVTDGFLVTNRPRIDWLRAEVRASARAAYQRHASAVGAAVTLEHVEDLTRGDRYLGTTQAVDASQLSALLDLQDWLERARAQRAQARDALAAAEAELVELRAQLDELRAREQALLDQWGAVPVMGDAWLTAEQLAAWYRSTNTVPKLAPGTTVDDLARFYVEEGRAERVRGDLAFAQGVVESAYFSVAAGNNYSGIGACDSCSGGFAFASPREGVRAQIQLLRNYADPDSRAANLARPPVKGLYPEDPAAAARVYDTFFLKGKVPLWNQMGNGNWATDPTYARKVIELFARIVAYAASH